MVRRSTQRVPTTSRPDIESCGESTSGMFTPAVYDNISVTNLDTRLKTLSHVGV